MILNFEYFDMC